jgi:hypothetical protein
MMTTTLRQSEAVPASYPDAPAGLSTAAAALDPKFIWHRIESYIAYRWTERAVTWTVEGMGWWVPPLTPATITTTEVWRGGVWEDAELSPAPLGGYCLPGCGPYRFTATVGGGSPAPEVPAAVSEAFRRLAEYMAAETGNPGASSEAITIGEISTNIRRSASWMASALQNSGAADLLRPYRRAQ